MSLGEGQGCSFIYTLLVLQYYYSLKDVSIGGRCVCNGHADVCDKTDPYDPARLVCRCQHNTCGAQCETCCPGFVQKQWKPVTLESLNECEREWCFTDPMLYKILAAMRCLM